MLCKKLHHAAFRCKDAAETVKFYTDEGNWDLVGNNIPVFFIQDAIKFPDLVHAVKEEQDRGFPQAQSAHDTFWDFVSLHTEAQHHTMWNMSDRASTMRRNSARSGSGCRSIHVTNSSRKGRTSRDSPTRKASTKRLAWSGGSGS